MISRSASGEGESLKAAMIHCAFGMTTSRARIAAPISQFTMMRIRSTTYAIGSAADDEAGVDMIRLLLISTIDNLFIDFRQAADGVEGRKCTTWNPSAPRPVVLGRARGLCITRRRRAGGQGLLRVLSLRLRAPERRGDLQALRLSGARGDRGTSGDVDTRSVQVRVDASAQAVAGDVPTHRCSDRPDSRHLGNVPLVAAGPRAAALERGGQPRGPPLRLPRGLHARPVR